VQWAQNLQRLQDHQRQRPLLYVSLFLFHRSRLVHSIWLPNEVLHGSIGKANGNSIQTELPYQIPTLRHPIMHSAKESKRLNINE
jgi:hypothetical protein